MIASKNEHSSLKIIEIGEEILEKKMEIFLCSCAKTRFWEVRSK